MPSTRRIRLYGFIIFATLVTYLTFTSFLEWSQSPDPNPKISEIAVNDFYTKTLYALEQEQSSFLVSGDDSLRSLRAAAAQLDSLRIDSASLTVKNKSVHPTDPPKSQSYWVKASNKSFQKLLLLRSRDASEADQELFRILSISPMVIFSKSACPFSQKAKEILLQKYTIYPKPVIVELDLHRIGISLQKSVTALTDRTTVPNILVYGQSIGGADEIADMAKKHSLISKINELAESDLRINLRE